MKRLFFLLSALFLFLASSAYDFRVDGIYYNKLSSNTAEVTSGSYGSYGGGVIIPENVSYEGINYSVSSIGNGAFQNCSGLTSIRIPKSVTSIGNGAFENCHGLTSITIPNSVTSLGDYAFAGCFLTSVTIPKSVFSIGKGAFIYCSLLREIIISESVNSIGENAFKYCINLTSITCLVDDPSGIVLGEEIFGDIDKSICTLYVPKDSKALYEAADQWKELGNIEELMPTAHEYLIYEYTDDTHTSWKVTGYTSVIPDNIEIPSEHEDLPVTSIGESSFCGCSGLTSITIPNSVTSIGHSAFSACSGLTAFYGKYASEDNRCLIINGNLIAFAPCGLTEYTIPNSVTSIGDAAFSGCSGLTSITIPYSVKSIGEGAFAGCNSLKYFYGNYASSDKRLLVIDGTLIAFAPSGLSEYIIPGSVTSIGDFAFQDCSGLTSITIPYFMTSIGNSAFSGCSGLESVTCRVEDPSKTTIGDNVFNDVPTSTCTLYVPIGSKTLYETTDPWKDFANIEEIDTYTRVGLEYEFTDETQTAYKVSGYTHELPDDVYIPYEHEGVPVTAIDYCAFGGCYELNSVIIPSSVTTIESCAFESCVGLTLIKIPETVTSIESSTFEDCSSLTSITIPNSVTYIAEDAFKGCSNLAAFYGKYASDDNRCLVVDGELIVFAPAGLTEYTIPNSVTVIGRSVFNGCSGLASITIPNSVTAIGSSAFEGCSGLTSITIPTSVTAIGSFAFEGCSGLTSITIPTSVTEIGRSAFENCKSLTSITIPESLTSIEYGTFYGCSSLTSITIPNSVTSIGNRVFTGCSGLTAFCGKYASDDNRCLMVDGKLIAFAPAGLTEYTIPETVTSIGEYAFSECNVLTSIIIPNSVTSIGNDAFYYCRGLKSITIGNSVTSIGNWAFSYCSGLTSITIPNSVTSIGGLAFRECVGLKSITCLVEDPSQINMNSNIFYKVPTSTCTLYVPYGSKELYEDADQWKDFGNIVELPSCAIKV